MEKPKFKPGINIALKIPKVHYTRTITFYRDVLGFDLKKLKSNSFPELYTCKFGQMTLWFDRVDSMSQTDIWMEVQTNDLEEARPYLNAHDIPFRSEVEKLPDGLKADWISDPAGVVLLLKETPL